MSYPRQAFLISKEHNYHLQCVSYIFIYFKQFSFKISANFSLWLDMEIIDHCSTSQNVRPLLQCTSLPLPSCPSLPSSSWQGQSGQPPWWCWPAAGWGWSGEGCRPWTSGLSKDLSKIPHGFLANRSNICHSWFSLNSLFFETPCSNCHDYTYHYPFSQVRFNLSSQLTTVGASEVFVWVSLVISHHK